MRDVNGLLFEISNGKVVRFLSKKYATECPHHDRLVNARGMCEYCYRKTYSNKPNKVMATCHPDRPHHSHGRCYRCAGNNRMWNRKVKKLYGMSQIEFNLLVVKQGYRCAMCRKKFIHILTDGKKKRPCIDHDHETGRVRGLLCSPCNSVLGYARDNQETLANGIKYLQSPPYEDVVSGKVNHMMHMLRDNMVII